MINSNADTYSELPKYEIILKILEAEMDRGLDYGGYNSDHEAYAVILEELDELWDIVKQKASRRDKYHEFAEAIQVAATSLRFAIEIANEARLEELERFTTPGSLSNCAPPEVTWSAPEQLGDEEFQNRIKSLMDSGVNASRAPLHKQYTDAEIAAMEAREARRAV